ncbi:unnamed protein product [Caenorhabditis auriculariae]|uniref:Mitochondrial fission factor n=1 Tax=Caenorhabditis auriculariae TaxID=2777116 RepID=A0A8S1H105_9PELO|nr:unnamed protein product [Caenorhabditis auriculariae]
MHVPEHITVTGDELYFDGSSSNIQNSNRRDIVEKMAVPDRITVAGGDSYGTTASYPNYSVENRIAGVDALSMEVPSTLTLDTAEYDHPKEISTQDSVATQNSIAVNENPLHELKQMRRQLGRLTERMNYLEIEIAHHNNKDKYMFGALFGFVLMAAYALLKR